VTEKRIIAIAGATGAQGGGLARAILADTTSDFAVRALEKSCDLNPELQSFDQWLDRNAKSIPLK